MAAASEAGWVRGDLRICIEIRAVVFGKPAWRAGKVSQRMGSSTELVLVMWVWGEAVVELCDCQGMTKSAWEKQASLELVPEQTWVV